MNVDEMSSVEVPYVNVNEDGGPQHTTLALSPSVLKRKLGVDATILSSRVDATFHSGPLLSPFLSSHQLKVCFVVIMMFENMEIFLFV